MMPFAVTNFVGAISAATPGLFAKSKAQNPITKVGSACRRGAISIRLVVDMILRPSLLRGGGGRLWLFGRHGNQCTDGSIVLCEVLACDPLNILGRHGMDPFDELVDLRHPAPMVSACPSSIALRKLESCSKTWVASTWFFARWSSCSVGGSAWRRLISR